MGLFSSIAQIAGGIGGFFLGGPAGAGLGSSLGGALGGAVDGKKQNKSNNTAINNATAAQNLGINNALGSNATSINLSQNQFAPYQMAGAQALGQQSDLLGLNGAGVQQSSIDALRASPLYQSLFANGQNTLLANASATGGLRGGDMQRGLADFGRDSLAQVIQQQLGNLGGLGQQGLAATGGIASLRNNNNAINAQLLYGQGANNAYGVTQANANNLAGNNAIGSALGGIDIGSLLSGLGGGFNGGGVNWGQATSGLGGSGASGWLDGAF